LRTLPEQTAGKDAFVAGLRRWALANGSKFCGGAEMLEDRWVSSRRCSSSTIPLDFIAEEPAFWIRA
jgi:hypothetical protein